MRLAAPVVMSSEQSQVVVAYDFSASAGSAMSRAIALAARAPFHVLHFVCVLDPHGGVAAIPTKHVDVDYADQVRDELATVVKQELRIANTKESLHFHVHVRISRHPAKEILELAREVGADLIVVGCHGFKGLERVMLGSVSERIVREARCAVVIARPKDYPYVLHEDVVEVEPHGRRRSFHFTYDDRVGVAEPMRWPGT
jgi:nucleotide-binding universal stress UspA family protein